MDVAEYIASGVLELYVAGTLSEEENLEVYQKAMKHSEIKEEIVSIEAAILELSKSVVPETLQKGFDDLKDRIGESEAVQPPKKSINWGILGSRAAAVLFAICMLWSFSTASRLKSDRNTLDVQNQELHYKRAGLRDSLVKSYELINLMMGENMLLVPLTGQKALPSAEAKIYWDKRAQSIYVDAQALPEPSDGFVYQVWALQLDHFTPISMGLLPDLSETRRKIFTLTTPDVHEAAAFGITLEPKGGSETPNLEQLYTLGTVSSSR